jgi:hypothetical protein
VLGRLLVKISVRRPAVLDECDFPQSHEANARTAPTTDSLQFIIHYLLYNVTQHSDIENASLNKENIEVGREILTAVLKRTTVFWENLLVIV